MIYLKIYLLNLIDSEASKEVLSGILNMLEYDFNIFHVFISYFIFYTNN